MRKTTFVALLVVGALMIPLGVFASHQFNDVPNSHTFHNAIDWMKDNNITVGCNPPANTNYCPDDNVTRGQMAAFMKRLAENNVADAATLDGKDSTEFLAPVAAAVGDGLALPLSTVVELAEVSLEAPAAGGFAITAAFDPESNVAAQATFWLQVDNATCTFNVANFFSVSSGRVEILGPGFGTSGVVTGAAAVSAGPHTVTFCGRTFTGGPISAESSLVVQYATSVTRTGTISSTSGDGSAGEPTS